MKPWLVYWLATLLVVAGLPGAQAQNAAHAGALQKLAGARLWPARDYTRLTIEARQPLHWTLFSIEAPERLVLDLDEVEPSGVTEGLPARVQKDDPWVKAIRVGRFRPGVLRIVLDLKAPVKASASLLEPAGDYGYRLVLDIYPAVPEDPLLTFLADNERQQAALTQSAGAAAAGQPALPGSEAPSAATGASAGTAAAPASTPAGGGWSASAPPPNSAAAIAAGNGAGGSTPPASAGTAGREAGLPLASAPSQPAGANAAAPAQPAVSFATGTPGASVPAPTTVASAAAAAATAASPSSAAPATATAAATAAASAPAGAGTAPAAGGEVAGERKDGRRKLPADRLITIAVDAGHGGEDPGAHGDGGTLEKDVTLAVARLIKQHIDDEPNLRAVLVRDGDYFIPLQGRTAKARALHADLFVSVHADAYINRDARGSSVFALSERGATSVAARWLANRENQSDLIGGVSINQRDPYLAQTLFDLSQTATIQDSLRLARTVLRELGSLNPLHRGQVEQAGFAVLKSPDIPSILVETAFITNPDEERRLGDARYQDKLAVTIVRGIRRYLQAHPPTIRPRLSAAEGGP